MLQILKMNIIKIEVDINGDIAQLGERQVRNL